MMFEIKTSTKILSVRELFNMIIEKQLHPNPVGQRLPVHTNPDNTKSVRIIESLYNGLGIGLIIVRDIRKSTEKRIKKLYPNNHFLVIDGGHRCRAIHSFIDCDFRANINGKMKYWSEMTQIEKKYLFDCTIVIEEKICTSLQAIEIFKAVNSTTQVNAYEMIMSNDQSDICRRVREFTRSYPEYDYNEYHKIFDIKEYQAENFTEAGERALWFTYIFIVLHKTLSRSNCDAGDKNTKNLIEIEDKKGLIVSTKDWNLVERFLDNLLLYRKCTQTKISQDVFGPFHTIWFKLLREYGENFKLDMEIFARRFEKTRLALTGRIVNQFNTMTVKSLDNKDEDANIKELLRKYTKSYSSGKKTSYAADIIWKHFLKDNNNDLQKCGIIVLDSKRSVSRSTRNELLVASDLRCYIDLHTNSCPQNGFPLDLDDCEFAHDTPYSLGGKARDGVPMCKICHSNQGMITLDEYVEHLKLKEETDKINT